MNDISVETKFIPVYSTILLANTEEEIMSVIDCCLFQEYGMKVQCRDDVMGAKGSKSR